jgi:hypothetical protein
MVLFSTINTENVSEAIASPLHFLEYSERMNWNNFDDKELSVCLYTYVYVYLYI